MYPSHSRVATVLAVTRYSGASQIVYARLLRLLYKLQVQMWRLVRKHDPLPYEESVLGFLEPRLRMLSRVSFYLASEECVV